MKKLIVYLNGERVGALDEDDSGLLEFRYAHEWTGRSDAMPLSRSLPLQSEPFRGKHARPFFAGILPDEGPRQQIAAILGISERNDFAMLERIGGECAGAVSLLPEDAPSPTVGETRVRELSERELEDIVTELPRRPLMAGREGLRLSLAGSQSKLPVLIREATIALPLGNTPSTHIIKPEPERIHRDDHARALAKDGPGMPRGLAHAARKDCLPVRQDHRRVEEQRGFGREQRPRDG